MNVVEEFVGRWFDCDPSQPLPEEFRDLCLPFVVTFVFAGERNARDFLRLMFYRLVRQRYMLAQ